MSRHADDLQWAATCEADTYLCEYDDTDDDGAPLYPEPDYGSRCGRSDQELAEIKAELAKRDMVLETDDRGLVARR